jgi:hypothetical protein
MTSTSPLFLGRLIVSQPLYRLPDSIQTEKITIDIFTDDAIS